MVTSRVKLRWRKTVVGAELVCFSALAFWGCDTGSDAAGDDPNDGAGGSDVGTGGFGTGGGITLGELGFGGSLDSCVEEADPPFFEGQQFDAAKPVARVVYSWTTAEQEAELRSGDALLLTGEAPGLGRGYAMDFVHGLAEPTPESGTAPDALAQAVLTVFTEYRYGWTNPWATRMGWPGETYGNSLIRIELRDDAWVVELRTQSFGGMRVLDLDGNEVANEEAIAHPERIALIYFARDSSNGGASCGTFSFGSNGYREFVIGNEAMIKEWSLGTEVIRERLESDIAELERFLELVRRCPPAVSSDFNADVVCGWGGSFFGAVPAAYANALALPSENYEPTPRNIVALVETLEGALFEPDPRVVTPGSN